MLDKFDIKFNDDKSFTIKGKECDKVATVSIFTSRNPKDVLLWTILNDLHEEGHMPNHESPVSISHCLSEALISLDLSLDEIESGFVACERCGDQEETKSLDFVDDVKSARREILTALMVLRQHSALTT